jgi:hypothetical protein
VINQYVLVAFLAGAMLGLPAVCMTVLLQPAVGYVAASFISTAISVACCLLFVASLSGDI